VITYAPLSALFAAEAVRRSEPLPPDVRATILELSEIDGGCFVAGVKATDIATLPENLLMLNSKIVKFPVPPFRIVIED